MITAFGARDLSLSCSSFGVYTVLGWPSIEVNHAASDHEARPLTFDHSHVGTSSQISWPEARWSVHSAVSRRLCTPVDVVAPFFAREL